MCARNAPKRAGLWPLHSFQWQTEIWICLQQILFTVKFCFPFFANEADPFLKFIFITCSVVSLFLSGGEGGVTIPTNIMCVQGKVSCECWFNIVQQSVPTFKRNLPRTGRKHEITICTDLIRSGSSFHPNLFPKRGWHNRHQTAFSKFSSCKQSDFRLCEGRSPTFWRAS